MKSENPSLVEFPSPRWVSRSVGIPGQPNLIHWSIPEPAREGGSEEESYPAFERTADELASRIPYLLDLIEHDLSTQEVTNE